MHKILVTTSALVLLGTGASFAQTYEPANLEDDVSEDIVETQDIDVERSTANLLLRPLDTGASAADAFKPSDQNDSPTPDIVQDQDFGDEGITSSAIRGGMMAGTTATPVAPDVGAPAAEAVGPSEMSDEPVPDIAQEQALGDRGFTTASVERATISPSTIDYMEENPLEPVMLEGTVTVGSTLPSEVELAPIPDEPAYSYVYLDQGPALVDSDTRTIVWVR